MSRLPTLLLRFCWSLLKTQSVITNTSTPPNAHPPAVAFLNRKDGSASWTPKLEGPVLRLSALAMESLGASQGAFKLRFQVSVLGLDKERELRMDAQRRSRGRVI